MTFTEAVTYGSCPTGRTVIAAVNASGVLTVTVQAYNSSGVLNASLERLNASENLVPPPYQGVWSGSGAQPGSTWTILFGIDTASLGSVVGTSAYPSLRCGGFLTLLSADETKVVFEERITFGSCVTRGKVILTETLTGSLGYQWYYTDGRLGSTGSLIRRTTWRSNRPTEEPFIPKLPDGSWDVPFLSQKNPMWDDEVLQSCNQLMGGYGCTVTSVAMIMRAYGVDVEPDSLARCLGDDACYLRWGSSKIPVCSAGIIQRFEKVVGDVYADLEKKLKVAPVILSLSRPCPEGTCSHFVVVVSGQGSDPRNYWVHDPNFENGKGMRLSATLASLPGSTPDGIRVVVLAQDTPLALPEAEASAVSQEVELTAAETVSGTVSLYRADQSGIILRLNATSAATTVTDVQITSEGVPDADWQPMTTWIIVPAAGAIQVRFRDALGNVSEPVLTGIPQVEASVIEEAQPRIFLPGLWRFR